MAKKMTYADIAEKLSKAYNKYDSALQNATTEAETNAATLMLKRVSDKMNQLMLDNQAQANQMDQKETAPDSPNQSIAQREMRMAKGGKLKPVPKGKKGKGLSKLPTAVRNKMGYMKEGGKLKPIPPDNKGLPMLAESVRNNMGYMKKGGSTFPDLTGDGKVTYADILKGRGVFQSGGQLYDGVTDEQITEQLLAEAGILSGLGDKFNPRNKDHVKKLQEGLLGAYTGPGADRMLSGTEFDFIGPDGKSSVNQAGVDGKFGIDTLTALQQFTDQKVSPVSALTPAGPIMMDTGIPPVDLSGLSNIQMKQNTNTGMGEEGSGSALKQGFNTLLGPGTKILEYGNKRNALQSMEPPTNMAQQSPLFLKTKFNIQPQLQQLADSNVLLGKNLEDSSTKRNNLRNKLTALKANLDRATGKLYADKVNQETRMSVPLALANQKIAKDNINTAFDNAEQARMFRNDKRGAQTRFYTNVVQDAQDLLTQRTNRQSQEDQLRALYPYLNMYGVGNRAYGDNFFSDAQLNNLIERLKAMSA
jgi:hypothetical protein